MVAAAVAVLLILGTGAAQPAQAQVESVIYNFGGVSGDGIEPYGALIRDSKGNLFGTTGIGGTNGDGTVFEEVYNSNTHSYTEQVLYSFGSTTDDGFNPIGGLIMDSQGDLYGVTPQGGQISSCETATGFGCGTVFELTPPSGDATTWGEKVLYNFSSNGSDESVGPNAGLVMDSLGNLYGTTAYGGTDGDGSVFELSPPSGGATTWTENTLYSFGSTTDDGVNPIGGLIMDSSGNLYGTTNAGGADADGVVFELKKATSTTYSSTDTVLYNFGSVTHDGMFPVAGLIMDSAGNLYGTTSAGGTDGDGSVFELKKATSTTYSSKDTVLYNFGSVTNDGTDPDGGLVMDSADNLYGATAYGGTSTACTGTTNPPGVTGCGTVFELKKTSSGYSSADTVLHNFLIPQLPEVNNTVPDLYLLADPAGNLYGTKDDGGSYGESGFGDGTVFGIAPVTLSATSLSFGSVGVGSTSTSQSVTINNIGAKSLSYGTPLISGTNAKDFSIATNGCTAALAPAGNCSVSVTFTPSTATADETATLNLTESGLTQTVDLSGTGAYPTAKLSPNLTFPDTLVGTSSAPQPVKLQNTSTTNLVLSIDSISVSTNYTETSTNCGSTLAAGSSCLIHVAFSPTTAGPLTGTLTVDDNTSTGSQSVTLSGNGETAAGYIQAVMIGQVTQLGLNGGQTNSLEKELDQAYNMITENKISGAISNLDQFIAEVNDLLSSGKLTSSQISGLTLLRSEAYSVIKSLE